MALYRKLLRDKTKKKEKEKFTSHQMLPLNNWSSKSDFASSNALKVQEICTYLLTLKSKRSHPPDKAASVQWTKKSKMTTSPTMRFPISDFYNF